MRLSAARVRLEHVTIDLPTEILLSIFGCLAKTDIKNVRLACKEFDAVASHYLFDSLYMSPMRNELDIFVQVMHHPIFSKSVREIIWYDVDFLPKCRKQSGWNSWYKSYRAHDISLPSIQVGDSEYCRLRYQTILAEVESIKRSGEDLAILCAGLATMTRVERIVLTDNSGQDPYHRYNPAAICNPPATLLPLIDWPDKLPEAAPSVWLQATSPYHGFIVITRAMSLVRPNIRDFIIETRGNAGISHRLFLECPHEVDRIHQSFRNLSKIDLSINLHRGGPKVLDTLTTGNIGKALAAAQSLTNLILRFDNQLRSVSPLSSVLGSGTWLCLRTFELESFYTPQPDLLQFLNRHSKILREVCFVDVRLSDGTWADVLDAMRNWSWPLPQCSFPDVWDSSNSDLYADVNAVRQFLHHGGPNPFTDPQDD